MEWFNDTTLQLMIAAIGCAALWSRNSSAWVYAFLILAHDRLFQELAGEAGTTTQWVYSAAIFSFFSVAGCLYCMDGINDDIGFNLAGISTVTLIVNIWTLDRLYVNGPTEVLNPIFAVINVASILVIAAGGRRDRRRKTIYNDTVSHSLGPKSRRVDDSSVLQKEAGA